MAIVCQSDIHSSLNLSIDIKNDKNETYSTTGLCSLKIHWMGSNSPIEAGRANVAPCVTRRYPDMVYGCWVVTRIHKINAGVVHNVFHSSCYGQSLLIVEGPVNFVGYRSTRPGFLNISKKVLSLVSWMLLVLSVSQERIFLPYEEWTLPKLFRCNRRPKVLETNKRSNIMIISLWGRRWNICAY